MHIPQYMLNGAICPVTAGVAAAGVGTAGFFAARSKDKPAALKFAAVTALIFAAQMLNFPVMNGTSGHIIGATFAILALGAPFGVISMALIVAVQSLIFADGGLAVLGANIVNMALIAAIPGIILSFLLKSEKLSGNIPAKFGMIFIASWLSTVFASLACGLEIGLTSAAPLASVLTAMIPVHMLIGIGEGVLTAVFAAAFENSKVRTSAKLSFGAPLAAAGLIGLILSPFASIFPDGLEWAAANLNLLHDAAPTFVSPLAGYSVPFVSDPLVSTALAGFIGVAVVFGLALLTGSIFSRKAVSVKA